jgi:hypothetical protein
MKTMRNEDFARAYGRYVNERRATDSGEPAIARRGAVRGGLACSCATCTCLCVAPEAHRDL